MTAVYLAALLSILLGAGAQVLLKVGVDGAAGPGATGLHTLWRLLMNPSFVCGMSAYCLSLVIWLYVLSRMEVSRAYPMVSLGYVITMILAYIRLGEALTPGKLIGAALIVAGVIMISRA